ncbi:MAG: aminotransferase class I/II-fold pyridoxal phosphate-dependent enzyme [Gammaproteobacteria bacterium]
MKNLAQLDAAALAAFHDTQRRRYEEFKQRGLRLDLTRGKPSPAQLDLASPLLRLPGEGDYLAADQTDCRNYGVLQGLPELRALLAPLFGAAPDQLVLGENSSLGLMHDTIVFALLTGASDSPRPWAKESRVALICPVPGYDRHFAICEQFGIEMIPVPLNDEGPDMDVVERLVAADAGIKGMWCMPKYSNPSGTVYSDRTIERLAAMQTAAPDFRLIWDNAYAVHHLTSEPIEIASIIEVCARHACPNRPLVFGSTSKMTLAGAGVSLFAGSAENVAWFLKRMGKRTIGADKVNQLRHVRFLRDTAGLLAHMDRHRAIIAKKFEAVGGIFTAQLGDRGVASWTTPRGGYFISLDVLDGCASDVIRLAKEAGVELTPAGSTYPHGRDPHDRNIRIAPTFSDLATVALAAEGVAISVLVATTAALQKTAGR